MDKIFLEIIQENLIWVPEKGIGFYPVKNSRYDKKYFDKYVRYERTPIGSKLNEFRARLVNKYTHGKILDIGIGCGSFIKYRGNCAGYDINPAARAWLEKRNLYFDPFLITNNLNTIKGITFFDSLEHIESLGYLFGQLTGQFVFISMPIFKNLEHLLTSKHYRKDEHYYYFTQGGLIKYMAGYHLNLLEITNKEIKCGREDIYTFVFKHNPDD